jgi:hypothetical protein
MAEIDQLEARLLAAQSAQGGWGYHPGGPLWTEPAAIAALALQACRADRSARLAAYRWLLAAQRPDGGWAPEPGVGVSTWVTALTLLALSGCQAAEAARKRALAWLLHQTGTAGPHAEGGVPWYPGTAGWVIPTAFSMLALAHAAKSGPSDRLIARLAASRNFLLERRLEDGGWDHGGARFGPGQPDSYPETTGLALLALACCPAAPSAQIDWEPSWRRAEILALAPLSVEGGSWLELAFLRQGRTFPNGVPTPQCRDLRDVSLRLITLCTREGQNVLWESYESL